MNSALLKITPYDSYKARVDASIVTMQESILEHVRAVMDLKRSNTWQAVYNTSDWNSYCKKAGLPFAGKTYTSYSLELPLAFAIIEATVDTVISPNDSRKIREKFSEIVAPEDKRLIPEIWGVCYAYDDSSIVPNANTIKAAYEVVKDERDKRSITLNGETFDVKALAQKMAVKEAVLENIQSHSGEKEKVEIVWGTIEIDGQVFLCVPPELQDRIPDSVNLWLPVVKEAE